MGKGKISKTIIGLIIVSLVAVFIIRFINGFGSLTNEENKVAEVQKPFIAEQKDTLATKEIERLNELTSQGKITPATMFMEDVTKLMNRSVDKVEWDGNEKSDRKMIYQFDDSSELVFVMQPLISDDGKRVGLLFRYWQAR